MSPSHTNFIKRCPDGYCSCPLGFHKVSYIKEERKNFKCVQCYECTQTCTARKHKCNNELAFPEIELKYCTRPKNEEYIDYGEIEQCRGKCGKKEFESQQCHCHKNRKCQCLAKHYLEDTSGDCKRCTLCISSDTKVHAKVLNGGCNDMAENERCVELDDLPKSSTTVNTNPTPDPTITVTDNFTKADTMNTTTVPTNTTNSTNMITPTTEDKVTIPKSNNTATVIYNTTSVITKRHKPSTTSIPKNTTPKSKNITIPKLRRTSNKPSKYENITQMTTPRPSLTNKKPKITQQPDTSDNSSAIYVPLTIFALLITAVLAYFIYRRFFREEGNENPKIDQGGSHLNPHYSSINSGSYSILNDADNSSSTVEENVEEDRDELLEETVCKLQDATCEEWGEEFYQFVDGLIDTEPKTKREMFCTIAFGGSYADIRCVGLTTFAHVREHIIANKPGEFTMERFFSTLKSAGYEEAVGKINAYIEKKPNLRMKKM